jgi:Flp pilus assembly pilin Flp
MNDPELRKVAATLRNSEEGQTMAEYGVVLTVIVVATVTIFTSLGDSVEATIRNVLTFLPG